METLQNLIDACLSRSNSDRFLSPMKPTLETEVERHNAYLKLTKRLGPRYAQCSFDNYVCGEDGAKLSANPSALSAVTEFAAAMPIRLKDGGGVNFYGNPGTGKDHLMAALMYSAILQHGFEVQWVNGLDLYARIRDSMGDNAAESEHHIIKELQAPPILVISDPLPPKGDVTRYSAETLYKIIDRRYRDLKPTWSTMNVSGGDEATDRLAANLTDRLRHGAMCIHFDWASYRLSAGAT